MNEWLLGNIYCRISIILNGSSFTVIIWCLDAINAYRYITIHRPIFRRDSIKYSTELVTNAFFWILGIIIFTIPLYQKKEFFRFPSNIHLCCLLKYSDIFSIVYTLLMYILNAIVLGVPIFKIYRILKILNKINVTLKEGRKHYRSTRSKHIVICSRICILVFWGSLHHQRHSHLLHHVIKSISNVMDLCLEVHYYFTIYLLLFLEILSAFMHCGNSIIFNQPQCGRSCQRCLVVCAGFPSSVLNYWTFGEKYCKFSSILNGKSFAVTI